MEIATAEVSHGGLSNENRRIHRVKRLNSTAIPPRLLSGSGPCLGRRLSVRPAFWATLWTDRRTDTVRWYLGGFAD